MKKILIGIAIATVGFFLLFFVAPTLLELAVAWNRYVEFRLGM